MSIWSRIGGALRRVLRGGGQQPPPSGGGRAPLPPEEPEVWDIPTGPAPGEPVDIISESHVIYIDRHRSGRWVVVERWRVGTFSRPPDLQDIRDILDEAGYRSAYTFVIYGIPCEPYPTKKGEPAIWLAYRIVDSELPYIALDAPDTQSAADWINYMVEGMSGDAHIGDCWENVYIIDILDRYEDRY